MSIKLTKNETTTNTGTNTTTTTNNMTASSLYEPITLMCKNNCGYYGNSTQYEGYCSICYRKLKTNKQYSTSSYLTASPSATNFLTYDDSSSLLSSSSSSSMLHNSHSFSNHYSLDDSTKENDKKNQSIWNDHSNLNKFQTKKDTRRSGTSSSSNAFKQFLRRPSSTTIAAAVDSAVNKVDKSVNMLSTDIANTIFENTTPNNIESNMIEFNNCLNRLVISPSTSSTITLSFTNKTKTTATAKNENTSALAEFEETFRLNFSALYSDLMKQMKKFVEKFLEKLKRNDQQTNITNNNKQYEVVQDFYKQVYKYITNNAQLKIFLEKLIQKLNSNASQIQVTFEDHSEKLYEAIMIMIESYVTNNIYDYVFPVIMSEFEDQDMNLQKRIRSFYWITNDMIGTCIDENSIFYRESYEEAINYIVEMDSKRTAHEKMLCITECSKNIYKAINISANIRHNINEANNASTLSESAAAATATTEESTNKSASRSVASADDYLPAFIYIVLKANPTMLYSNMNFISRFAFEKRVLQGEHAYHFCSLGAITNHIENLNAQHLNMTQDKFEDYCNGLIDINSSSNILKLIQSNLKILSELKDKQNLLRQETKKLQLEMSSFKDSMENKFNSCLDRNPTKLTENIEGYTKKKLILDDDNNNNNKNDDVLIETQLPQLLVPQSLSVNLQENN